MILSVQISDRIYKIDSDNPRDISISLDFNGEQPNAFGVEKATATACETGDFVGDTRRGGSCNFERIKFIPHCNGTHTECVGHVTNRRISVTDCLREAFIPATLISVEPKNALRTDETYAVGLSEQDKFITKISLENALRNADADFLEGLIVRLLPNDDSKMRRDYMENPPPFFSAEAINFIVEKRVKHLVVDIPSIDRAFDEGKLSNHRIFWNVKAGEFETNEASLISNTITEMAFAPDSIEDGSYLLNLQIAAFTADAAPSRPLIFKVSD